MASILKVDTITGVSTAGSIAVTGEGNSTTTNLQQGLVKAWAKCTNAAGLDDSFNISGGTDNGTGDYTYAYTNNMANGNFCQVTDTTFASLSSYDGGEMLAASFNVRIFTRQDSLELIDDVHVSQVSGDLA